jgi:GT2 family glycosyltransferase
MSAHVTVVIPARNAAATIGAQLDALATQADGPSMEVVVADNGSNDNTRDVVGTRNGRFESLKIIDASDRPGPAHARNQALDAASHELVLGCDADDLVDLHWAGRMTAALESADLVGGAMRDWHGGAVETAVARPLGTAGLGYLPACNGSNFAVRRSVWGAVGGFEESLPTCEDIDFAWRAQEAGYRFASCADAVVNYRLPADRSHTVRTWFAYGRYQPELYARHRGAGFTRQALTHALGRDALLLATCFRLAGGEPSWREWCMQAAKRAGRIRGSASARVLFF